MANKKYLCIQRSQSGCEREMEKPSPAQMEEMYSKFNAWKKKFQANIVDMGGKLGGGKVVHSDGVTDGPFVEAKEIVDVGGIEPENVHLPHVWVTAVVQAGAQRHMEESGS